jgi:hypothetical protein
MASGGHGGGLPCPFHQQEWPQMEGSLPLWREVKRGCLRWRSRSSLPINHVCSQNTGSQSHSPGSPVLQMRLAIRTRAPLLWPSFLPLQCVCSIICRGMRHLGGEFMKSSLTLLCYYNAVFHAPSEDCSKCQWLRATSVLTAHCLGCRCCYYYNTVSVTSHFPWGSESLSFFWIPNIRCSTWHRMELNKCLEWLTFR